MTEARSSEQILRDIIAEHYDLGETGIPHPMPGAHQRRHRKLVTETARGTFVIKTYSNNATVLDALRFQHRLSDHLALNKLPVARIQRARNGKRIVEVDDWALELQQFIQGIPMPVTKATLATAGEALGHFHESCRDIPRPSRDARMWRFSEVPRDMFATLYDLALAEGDEHTVKQSCNRIALFLAEASQALSAEKRQHFETGLIHGDWHSGNLLFVGQSLSAILDLEFAGEGCYLEDIAYALSNLCIRTTTDHERLQNRVNILLDHYQFYRSLSFLEEMALYYAVGMKHIATVAFQMRSQSGQVAGYGPADWIERLANQCDWLAQRAKRIRGL